MTDKQLTIGAFGLLAVAFLFAFVVVGIAAGADGLNMQDPLWRYSNSPAKQNRIQWDGSRRQTQYWLNDPIWADGRFIIWIAPSPTPAAKPTGTYSADGGILFDYDPVGE